MEEEDEIQAQHKFPRVGNEENNGRRDVNNRFNSWHHSSRIIRVSRASGGKDRHSKVMTSKGLRDRRVRLSVTTAIQFYDLQDRLGYDQPSKAVEWLIKSASDAISELPSLNNSLFTDTNNQLSEQGVDSVHSVHDAEMVVENGGENNYHGQNLSLSKSGCSSTSETSKGSGLSLSRSDARVSRVKARERARERTAKEKEKENHHENVNNPHHQHHQQHHNVNVNSSISQTASFTELLTGGINNTVVPTTNSPRGSVDEPSFFNKARQQQQQQQQWSSSAPMDHYFSPIFLGSSSSRTQHQHHHQLGHSLHDHQSMNMSSPFNSGENHSADQNQNQNHHQHHLQHQYSFLPDHMMQNVVTSSSTQPSGNNDYNLNFTISSGLAGYNRGTLQSNSPSLLSHLQRFSVSPLDGPNNLPFFMGGGAASASHASASPAPTAMESNHNHNHHHQIHHHQFSSVFDGSSLQLYSDQKGKSKN
ncbi:hypothetical protein TSUD_81910 [Trifolium subterraneum]|uniref:TCP domain-containing protein n=1 Tax=Trifolium subterraneum TaxID=3900 RepID=A0A2Z6P1I7_TRISU|nr:hypothetical protein TSUD_81910 [Trifolium subterraneum]